MVLCGPDERTAGFDDRTVGEFVIEHAAADPVAGLEHQDRLSFAEYVAGGYQS